uniref:FRIGIDA-like protein n=1 Tax=Mesocestoides corti TaxID=53468 RepID=A0A5K3G3V4_MESCO
VVSEPRQQTLPLLPQQSTKLLPFLFDIGFRDVVKDGVNSIADDFFEGLIWNVLLSYYSGCRLLIFQ